MCISLVCGASFVPTSTQVHAIKGIALGEEGEEPGVEVPRQPAPVDFSALEVPYGDQEFEQPEQWEIEQDQEDMDEPPEDEDGQEAVAPPSPPQAEAELPPAAGAQPLTSEQVRSMDFGYGDGGASVQPSLHAQHLTDRYIVKMTLLRGTPKISCKQACDKLRSSREKGRKALPRVNWMAVMTTASKESPILELSGDELQIARIPEDATLRVEYHNNLMTLCGLSLRELVDAMKQAVEKAKQAAPKEAAAKPPAAKRQRTNASE